MSIRAMEWAFNSGIPTGPRFVLLVLADHAGEHKGEPWKCYPSMDLIQEKTGQSIKTIERHLEWLADNGWISRRIRPGRRRQDGLYDYTLNREKGPQPSDNLSDDQAARPSDKLTVDQGRPSDNLGGDHPTICPQPSDNLGNPPDPLIRINPHRTVSEPARGAGADTDTPDGLIVREFGRLSAAWAKVSPGRLAPKPGLRAFRKAAALVAPERLADAGLRYLKLDPDVAKFGAMLLHRWLDEGRWDPWLVAGDQGGGAAAQPASWTGPPEIREAVVRAKGEAWAASYLDPAEWRDGAVRARTGLAARALDEFARTYGGFVVEGA